MFTEQSVLGRIHRLQLLHLMDETQHQRGDQRKEADPKKGQQKTSVGEENMKRDQERVMAGKNLIINVVVRAARCREVGHRKLIVTQVNYRRKSHDAGPAIHSLAQTISLRIRSLM
jgi:hypothetical protein